MILWVSGNVIMNLRSNCTSLNHRESWSGHLLIRKALMIRSRCRGMFTGGRPWRRRSRRSSSRYRCSRIHVHRLVRRVCFVIPLFRIFIPFASLMWISSSIHLFLDLIIPCYCHCLWKNVRRYSQVALSQFSCRSLWPWVDIGISWILVNVS